MCPQHNSSHSLLEFIFQVRHAITKITNHRSGNFNKLSGDRAHWVGSGYFAKP